MFLQKWILIPQDLLQNRSLETVPTCIVLQYYPHNITVCIHIYNEYKISSDSGVCHKLWSIFVIDRASLFTDHRTSGLPIRAKKKHFRTIWEHSCDNSPTDFNSSSCQTVHLFGFCFLSTVSRHVTVNSTPWTVFLELLILPALRRQIHRHRLRVFRANSTFSISFTNFVHSVLQAVLISKWSRTPRLSKPLMTTPILIRSDSVFCFMLPPRDSSFISVKEIVRWPLNVAGSKSTSFETVVVHIVGREVDTLPALQLCRFEHQPLCSSSCQHDQRVVQLSGNVAKQSRFQPQCRERQVNDGCRFV